MNITINIRKSKQCNGDASLFINFPYSAELVDIIREQPTRYWDKDTKEWEVPLKKLPILVSKFEDHNVTILAEDAGVFIDESEKAVNIDYKFKTTPFQHQIDGFNYGLTHDKWLLGDEQGLGKTKQVIDIAVAKKLQYGYQHALIICGVNGLKWNWQNEISIHSDESGYILGQREKKGRLVIGSTKDKIADLDALEANSSYFIITNVESLRDETLLSKLSSLCARGVIELIAADEAHKMKNPTSQQGKAFLKLQAKTMIAMTGTPLMNSPLDFYIILKWLGVEKHAFYSFKNHYCVMGGYGNYQIMGYKHLDELQESINDIMLRRLKDDVLDLPEKTFINEYVEMTAKQSVIYKEIFMDVQANIDAVKASPNPLAEMIRMRQATGYTGILSSTIKESAKLDRMEELVADAVENGKKVVIFSNWTQITDEVMQRLVNYHPAIITGDTKDADRQSMVNAFQNDDKCKVICGTIGAMGTGLTLTAGSVEIFLDEPWNMALKEQAMDRCHRIGQKSNVTIYTLLTKNTIDEKINQLVEKKGAMASALVDGQWNGDKGELVDFLLS